MKVCKVCDKKLPLSSFRDRRSCNDCENARIRKWAAKNRDKISLNKKEYYLKNKEHIAARVVKWQKENPDKVKKNSRATYLRHKDTALAYSQAYRQTPEGYFKMLVSVHWQRIKRFNPNAKKTRFSYEAWNSLLKQCEYKCPMCLKDFNDTQPPTIDHIISIQNGGSNDISNIQPLCKSCNTKKGILESGRDALKAQKIEAL